MAERPDFDTWGMNLAQVVATRATCVRRSVGAVLLDRYGRILATGYNGRASGLVHCSGRDGRPCSGPSLEPGTHPATTECEALHAEWNACLQCREVRDIKTCIITVSPCFNCAKLLLNTGTTRIVFGGFHSDHEKSERLWKEAGRAWVYLPPQNPTVIKERH
jgi:dCMP deaminase